MSLGLSVSTPVRMLQGLTWPCPGLRKERMKATTLFYDPLRVTGRALEKNTHTKIIESISQSKALGLGQMIALLAIIYQCNYKVGWLPFEGHTKQLSINVSII